MECASTENRHGLAVAGMATYANGTVEHRAAEIICSSSSSLSRAGSPLTSPNGRRYNLNSFNQMQLYCAAEQRASADKNQEHGGKIWSQTFELQLS
jgi:hypothetical protein